MWNSVCLISYRFLYTINSTQINQLVCHNMEGHQDISEQPLSAREKSLREKIVRLENQLQGYKSQIGKVYSTLVDMLQCFLSSNNNLSINPSKYSVGVGCFCFLVFNAYYRPKNPHLPVRSYFLV